MIFGIGIDIIEVSRIEKEISKKDYGFRNQVFTPSEIDYCQPRANRAESYGARFAAKEALFKAMGSGWSKDYSWKEIETVEDEKGKPSLITHGKVKNFLRENEISKIEVSLSHIKELATAFVILEK